MMVEGRKRALRVLILERVRMLLLECASFLGLFADEVGGTEGRECDVDVM